MVARSEHTFYRSVGAELCYGSMVIYETEAKIFLMVQPYSLQLKLSYSSPDTGKS